MMYDTPAFNRGSRQVHVISRLIFDENAKNVSSCYTRSLLTHFMLLCQKTKAWYLYESGFSS
jgi:hypothetical protein